MRHWHANGIKPHLVRGFKVSRDPKFVDKLRDVVGLYVEARSHPLYPIDPVVIILKVARPVSILD